METIRKEFLKDCIEHLNEYTKRVKTCLDLISEEQLWQKPNDASNSIANARVQSTRYYSVEDNGLLWTWEGRIWLNPPYSQPEIGLFVEKLEASLPTITSACVLTNNATETKWGQRLLRISHSACFLSSRVKFLTPEGSPKFTGLQGQMVCYIGNNPAAFAQHFQPYGLIYSQVPLV